MTARRILILLAAHLLMVTAAADEAAGPRYTADGALLVPADYREWLFLSAGLDMSYSEAPAMRGHSMFDNVFVNRSAWERFKSTGHWPDGTVLVMEVRGANSKGSINKRGQYQTGDRMGLEFHVHDEARFKGGWAFFVTGGDTPAVQVPFEAECYECHRTHGAVDSTFTQFYPTARAIAEKAGTFRGE